MPLGTQFFRAGLNFFHTFFEKLTTNPGVCLEKVNKVYDDAIFSKDKKSFNLIKFAWY